MSLFDWFELSLKLGLIVVTRARPLPVEFEPCPWNGPMPDRWLVSDNFTEAYSFGPGVPAGWLGLYSDDAYETVSRGRVRQ